MSSYYVIIFLCCFCQAAISNLLICFCSFDLSCPTLEKDNFIKNVLYCIVLFNRVFFLTWFVSIYFRMLLLAVLLVLGLFILLLSLTVLTLRSSLVHRERWDSWSLHHLSHCSVVKHNPRNEHAALFTLFS